MFYEIMRAFLISLPFGILAGKLAGRFWVWYHKDRDES